nr:MAG TPA: hypothetical protein [Bacteriophage sp.]
MNNRPLRLELLLSLERITLARNVGDRIRTRGK